ncbi:hypothetical protein FLA_1385 [Filimonas lacunae]|nr:hypothetical protein FLA_1385 [Filimonas lacunae]
MLLLGGLLPGCSKETADTTPSGISNAFTLPQGNHDFDTRIVNYFQKYGSYFLYQFIDRDMYWTPTANTKPVASSAGFWSTGAEYTLANTDYINAQLDLVQQQWFNYYTDTFLHKFLPSKIFLCGKLDSIYATYVFTPTFAYAKGVKPIGAYYSYDNIAIGYGRDTISTFTATDKRNFLARVNSEFIKSIAGRSASAPIAAFTGSASYTGTINSQALAYSRGIILTYYNTLSVQADWNAYMLAMVTYSETELKTSTANTDMTPKGMLNTTKDSNGKIKLRYNLVRNYFINEYGVDLQKIGNAAKGQ